MNTFNQTAFNQFVKDNQVIGFFDKPITLKSGRESTWYVNWRTACSDVFLMDEISTFLIKFVQDLGLEFDTFYGVPEGATKLGVISQLNWAKTQKNYAKSSHILPMGRSKPKEHGAAKDRFFIGEPNGRIILLEDVVTTGGSLLTTLDHLQDLGKDITAVICLTDRCEPLDNGGSFSDLMKEKNIPYYAMSKATELLD